MKTQANIFLSLHFLEIILPSFCLLSQRLIHPTLFLPNVNIGFLQPYDLGAHGTPAPAWNETIIIHEDYYQVMKPSLLLLFELVEFALAGQRSVCPLGVESAPWTLAQRRRRRVDSSRMGLLSSHGQ